MESLVRERKDFNKILEDNISFYGKHWTNCFPVQTYLGNDVVLDWMPNENKQNVNPVYKDVEIKYHINKDGYRYYPGIKNTTDKKTKKLYCFGCSFTLGHGLPDEHTWPYLLAKKLGPEWEVYNFGKQGVSIQAMTEIFYQVITTTSKEDYPDAVFFLLPEIMRDYYLGNIESKPIETSIIYNYNFLTTYDEERDNFYKHPVGENIKIGPVYRSYNSAHVRLKHYAYTSMVEAFMHGLRFFNIIRESCNARNLPWYWYSWSFNYCQLEKPALEKYLTTNNTLMDGDGLMVLKHTDRKSRDSSHFGFEPMEQIANGFAKLYLKQ